VDLLRRLPRLNVLLIRKYTYPVKEKEAIYGGISPAV